MTAKQEQQQVAEEELRRNKKIDRDFERVTREHSNIFDFIWEEPRLAWDGGWIPVCGSVLLAFHVSRTILWPKLVVVANINRFGGRMTDRVSASSVSPFQKKSAPKTKSETSSRKISIPQMMFEIATGFSVGTAVSSLTNDRSLAEKTAVAIPLKAGNCRLCDKLCPALIDEYERQWNLNETTRRILKEPTYQELKVTLDFVRNCQRRHLRVTGIDLEESILDRRSTGSPTSDSLLDDECVAKR